jgi:DNA topoisomerase-1
MEDGTEIKADEPIGTDPESGLPVFVLTGRFGPYVQLGEKTKTNKKPRRASIPKEKEVASVTLEDALRYLSLPRELGPHPDTGDMISANVGRFGPYIVHQGDFRSLKGDDPYTITLERALEILKEPKKTRAGEKLLREVGLHPRTKKQIKVFESKSGRYFKRGFKRIPIPDNIDIEAMTVEEALELMK